MTFFSYSKMQKRTIDNDDGAVIPLIAISIVLLVVFSVMAVDFARVFLVRSQLQYATDAAVLGATDIATRSLSENDPGAIQERALQFFNANFPDNYLDSTVNFNGTIVDYDPDTGVVSSNITVDIPLVFAGVYRLNAANSSGSFTQNSIDTSVLSQAINTLGGDSIEVALAVDISDSMCNEFDTGLIHDRPAVRDPSCAKFEALRNTIDEIIIDEAENTVTSTQVDFDNGGGIYFSLIPFTHDVRLPSSTENFNFVNGVRAGSEINATGLFGRDPNYGNLRTRIANLQPLQQGGTNTAIGLWHAWASLSPTMNNMFDHEDESLHPAPYTELETFSVAKVAMLLTDGQNAYTNFNDRGLPISGTDGLNTGITGATGIHIDETIDDTFLDICRRMERQEVQIYTVGYNIPCIGESGRTEVAELLSQCSGDARHYCARDEEELREAFDDFFRALVDLRITQ